MGLFVKKLHDQRGYSLLEIGIVVSVFSVLISIATINLLGSKQKVSIAANTTLLVSDIKQQQIKAMTLATQGGGTANYGIYFTPTNYVLFRGSSYLPSDVDNFTVLYDDNITASVSGLPQATIIFARQSGEVVNFDPNKNTLILTNVMTNEKKTIQINRYGVITQAN